MGDNQDHNHDHLHNHGIISRLIQLVVGHQHELDAAVTDSTLASDRGMQAVKRSFIALMATAMMQVVIVIFSSSVALLADTVHNFSDALTAIPLWVAFSLARRPRSRQFPYGYGRAEDIAAVFILIMIFASAGLIFYESVQKIRVPVPISNPGWVMAAALIGFLGNEGVAIYRIRIGKQIGSAALVADGIHARSDGLSSIGVLIGAVGSWLGFSRADPLVGLLIGLMILLIGWRSAGEIGRRLMDAVNPDLIDQAEKVVRGTGGVKEVKNLRIRWLGHQQLSEFSIVVDCQLPTYASHQIAEEARHRLLHALPHLAQVIVHVDPCPCEYLSTPDHLVNHPETQ